MWQWVDPVFSLALTLVVAWFWGSFLNAAVDRTPPRRLGPEARAAHPNLLWPPRSFCFSCRTRIPWFDNVPVVSYLWLRGRCRSCGTAIGSRTLVLESAVPLLFAGWHEAARVLGWDIPGALWGYGGLSWLLVAIPVWREQRRFGAGFAALGLVLAAGLAWMLCTELAR